MLQALCSFHDRYRILHLNWFARFLSFVVWFSVAPFATTIQHELHLTATQLKVLAICNLALAIPARIAIGMVLDRYGPRLTFSALLVFAIVPCWLTATAHDFNQLVWSSLINGIMGAGFVAGVRMVAEWFPSKEIGLAQGIYGGWGNFGAAASGFCLPLLAVTIASFTGGTLNWRMAIVAIGLVTALYGSIYFHYTQDTPPGEVYQRPGRHGGLEVTSAPSFLGNDAVGFRVACFARIANLSASSEQYSLFECRSSAVHLGLSSTTVCISVLQSLAGQSGNCRLAQSLQLRVSPT